MTDGCKILIIFSIFWGWGCTTKESVPVRILWEESHPVGLIIQKEDASGIYVIGQKVSSDLHILGKLSQEGPEVHFQPLIDLSFNQTYYVFDDEGFFGSVLVPIPDGIEPPQLIAIYPSSDSLPQNLLKIYLLFSKPIPESSVRSVDKVKILFNDSSLNAPFLDLKPELWNADRTMLTLWLDPGRIKTGLIPNKKLGLPLKSGKHELIISDEWADMFGLTLTDGFRKIFISGEIDRCKPRISNWTLRVPSARSREPLEIHFDEPIDFATALEGIEIFDQTVPVTGLFMLSDHESTGLFRPDENWNAGKYRIKIASRIEDLSGNNLNRLFEEDILSNTEGPQYYWMEFEINLN